MSLTTADSASADQDDLDSAKCSGSVYLSAGESLQGSENDEYEPSDFPEDRALSSKFIHHWKRTYQAERELYASLEALHADDLSIHLHNVHALKRRLRPTSRGTRSDERSEAKNRLAAKNKSREWAPDASWSAWPLPPDRVPKPGESFSRSQQPEIDETDVIKRPRKGPEKPSQELEECLLGEMLKKSREAFYASDLYQTEFPRPFATRQNPTEDGPPKKKRKTGNFPKDRLPAQSLTENDSNRHTNTHKLPQYDMIDEDDAHEIVKPAIRQILSKFDSILMALHRSRLNNIDLIDSGSEIGTSASSSYEHHTDLATSASSHRLSNKRHGALSTLNPRDWREILGMAAITGWDEDVVKRASTRCAELFGQPMSFRTLKEEAQVHEPKSMANGSSAAHTDFEISDDDTTDDERIQKSHTARYYYRPSRDGFTCPIKTCKRHKKPFSRRSGVRRHMRDCHRSVNLAHASEESEEKITSDGDGPGPDLTSQILPRSPPADMSCPLKSCKRYDAPFRDRHDWARHMNRFHGLSQQQGKVFSGRARVTEFPCSIRSCPRYSKPYSRSRDLRRHMEIAHSIQGQPEQSEQGMSDDNNSGERTFFPDHADIQNLCCPMSSCSRHAKPFSSAYHLRRHVRDVHGSHDQNEVSSALHVTESGEKYEASPSSATGIPDSGESSGADESSRDD